MIFRILKLEKKMMMSKIQIQGSPLCLQQKLATLLELVPQGQRATLSQIFRSRLKKLQELYTPVEPEQVLKGLMEKTGLKTERKNWKVGETSYLLLIMEKYCCLKETLPECFDENDWQTISEYIPGRTAAACQFRFLALVPPSVSTLPWTQLERELLGRIIQNLSPHTVNWKVVSERLYELSPLKHFRTGKQCREHYTCFLRPNLKKGSWNEQEDYELICLFLKFGKKWSKMARMIEGRNQNAIKNRFFLMFENKKEGRLSNSDLVKVVKRRKEKLQKKISLKEIDIEMKQPQNQTNRPTDNKTQETAQLPQMPESGDGEEQKVVLTSTNSESLNQSMRANGSGSSLFQESEIFMPEQGEFAGNEPYWDQGSCHFEQFISF